VIEGFGQAEVKEARAAEPCLREELISVKPSPAVAPWLSPFVYRYDAHCGHVVHELPLLIPTVQIMLADDYWLRERDANAKWAPVPRIAFWGPRITWGYGYARRVVRAFSFALTPRGFDDLIGRPMETLIDRVVDVADLRPDLAAELQRIVARGGPEDWIRETTDLVLRMVDTTPAPTNELDDTIHHLADEEGDAVARASKAAGLGDRQYRRLFRMRYGLSPRLYRRVLRVDRLMRRIHPAPWHKDEHATDLTFADQPHMIREFKALTGVTPGEYVRSKRDNNDRTIRSFITTRVAPPP
jgi:AraC-like DNA-binding protein